MTDLFTLLANAPVLANTPGDWPRNPNMLTPEGPAAARIAELWWFLFTVAAIVFAVVMVLFLIALFRRGSEVEIHDGRADEDRRVRPLLLFGVGATALILVVTAVYTFTTMGALASPGGESVHTFDVIGKRWWWEVRYGGETLTANELHLPVGEPVLVRLHSDNVIHSFWVPDLSGKRDLIPGQVNTLWLTANEPGVYRGLCAEFCGVQHANMAFTVVAEPPEQFRAWLRDVQSPAREPVGGEVRAGQAVFMNAGCAGCHTVRGTAARGQLGPDLTHLSSRLTLGAGTLPNTKGHLGGWVVNPQRVKPGNLMPPQRLASGELQQLLAYLTSLD